MESVWTRIRRRVCVFHENKNGMEHAEGIVLQAKVVITRRRRRRGGEEQLWIVMSRGNDITKRAHCAYCALCGEYSRALTSGDEYAREIR